jgi:putative ABC transport system permease protein
MFRRLTWIRIAFRSLIRRKRVNEELDTELQDHLDREIEEGIKAGLSPEEARFAAMRVMGAITKSKDECRDARGTRWLEDLALDCRYGIRVLYRQGGFTAIGVIALAIGIGVNTAVFTAYKAMVARPIQAHDSERMANLALIPDSGAAQFTFSYPDYEAYRDSLHSFNGLIATNIEQLRLSAAGGIVSQRTSRAESGLGRLGLFPSGATNVEFTRVLAVSENYFKVLGVPALRGSTFDSMGSADRAASPPVLISENYWQKRFEADPAVLGKTVQLNGVAVTVIGITPHNFIGTYIGVPDFWIPLSLEPLVHADQNWLRNAGNRCCRLFGRVAPGVSMAQAQAELKLAANHLRAERDPRFRPEQPMAALVWRASPFPLPMRAESGEAYGFLNLAVLLIMAAAALVLIVACADVGSLQLARARSRQHEIETRGAIGASRQRIIRQLLTENALLGLLSGTLALLVTWALLKYGVAYATAAFPAEAGTLIFDVTPDFEIFAYTFGISLIAAILFGLAPAIESSRSTLSLSTRSGTSSARSRRLQDLLVAAQVALSLVLMIAGSMFIRSSLNTLHMNTGYDDNHVIDMDLQFPEGEAYSASHKLAIVQELRTRLDSLPGISSVTSAKPPGNYLFVTAIAPTDNERSPGQNLKPMPYARVQANYFQTLGIPVFLGRTFESPGETEREIVVSESAAKQLWPNENPIGRSLRLGPTDERFHNPKQFPADGPVYQVIGVARDTRGAELDGRDSRLVYLPVPEDRVQDYPIMVRTSSDPSAVERGLEASIFSVDPDLAVTSTTLHDMLLTSPSFILSAIGATVASMIGLLGLLLALMGIYGTVSYLVVLRTREIGIRMAVGASARAILGLILRESARPVVVGLLAGSFLAVGTSYMLRGILYRLSTIDGVSFVGVSIGFLVIALLATYPPSRRATRVDPIVTLRHE